MPTLSSSHTTRAVALVLEDLRALYRRDADYIDRVMETDLAELPPAFLDKVRARQWDPIIDELIYTACFNTLPDEEFGSFKAMKAEVTAQVRARYLKT